MPGKTKKFRLFDAVLAAVCVVLVVESAAPAAAIGNSQFFWWFFLLIGFFLPYALISAELGTTYEDEGGIYDWVKKAYGPKWGSRVAWYYYINFPLWMGSLAVLFTDLVSFLMGSEMSTFSMLIWQIAFIWIVVLISSFKISDSKWILNIAAIFKAIIMLAIGFLGIYASITKGAANDYSIETFIPGFNLQSLSNISVIIFNFLGFEVVTTFASEMDNPKKQIPKAIILGGIFIAIFYILASFGIGVAVPRDELSASSGLIDSFVMLTGRSTGIVIVIFTLMFIYTLAANLISWSLGVNYVAMYAAKQNGLPKFLEKESKGGMPMGANITNGVIATLIVIVSVFIPSEDIFWSFFALNMITLLLSYILMFPSFLRLRKTDPKKERPFKINGGGFKLKVITYVPMILLILSVLLSLFPLSSDPAELSSKIPLIIGTAAAVIIGEIIAVKAK